MQRKEWRVKAHRLDVDGKWQDKGTGNVKRPGESCVYIMIHILSSLATR